METSTTMMPETLDYEYEDYPEMPIPTEIARMDPVNVKECNCSNPSMGDVCTLDEITMSYCIAKCNLEVRMFLKIETRKCHNCQTYLGNQVSR